MVGDPTYPLLKAATGRGGREISRVGRDLSGEQGRKALPSDQLKKAERRRTAHSVWGGGRRGASPASDPILDKRPFPKGGPIIRSEMMGCRHRPPIDFLEENRGWIGAMIVPNEPLQSPRIPHPKAG